MTAPEWELGIPDYLNRLECTEEEFRKYLWLPDMAKVERIVPFKDLEQIDCAIPITMKFLEHLLTRIQTLDGQRPFLNITFRMVKVDPGYLKIGQKFVYRENYQGIIENVTNAFANFAISTGGLGNLGAYFIFGRNSNGECMMACYIPPLVEKHGDDLVIMDGIHRNFIARQTGQTLNAILIEGVSLPFPCATTEWSEIKVISVAEKPKDINERYFDLKQGLFRDLKYLGIDG